MTCTICRRSRNAACLAAVAILTIAAAHAQETPQPDKAASTGSNPGEAKAAPATHKVAAGPLKVEVTLSGIIESSAMHEVALTPQEWSQWIVVEAAALGKRVKKGDILVKFDSGKIEEQLRDLVAGHSLSDLALTQAQRELALLEESTPVNLAIAERTKKIADEDQERYESIEANLALKSEEFQLKLAKQVLEYNEEELKQLEKMYKADDLTEETEEIVLKRARNDVEQAQFRFEQTKIGHERAIKFELPRALEDKKNAARQADLAWEKARTTLPLALSKQRLDVEKLARDLEKAKEKLAELNHDREQMTLRAPADGIVYFGRCVRGKWTTAADLALRLHAGGAVQPREVIMTIVGNGNLFVRASLPEKELADVQSGTAGIATPTAFPKARLAVAVAEVSPIPISDGTFEARLNFTGKWTEPLVAGMASEVKLVAYHKADAIAVPSKAVFAEELDDEQRYVYLTKDGKSTKQAVQVGRTSGENVEIVTGLKAGDEILLEKPEK